MYFSALAILATCLFLNLVHGHEVYSPSDIRCPKGSLNIFVHNSYTYLAPLDEFTDVTGSFFNLTWYANTPVNETTGEDNVPGATRSGPWLGGIFHEVLTAITAHPDDKFEYTYQGEPATFNGVDFEGYVETLRFESICGGKATYIDVLTYACSRQQIVAYSDWYGLHDSAFPSLAASVGARIFNGDCSDILVLAAVS
ncbi:hypothetical protein FB45DRAFT_1060264 [Roridomyces roridus]|uniref:Uncharacterized protein n=1 Tax=Roridomyces roridus TaxID=1738132 RepID=A0AAD7BMJ7_9AGAR|nr:hypothetical protein FB45DRAFT_1060264 [Roridomyces roridus]